MVDPVGVALSVFIGAGAASLLPDRAFAARISAALYDMIEVTDRLAAP